MSRARIEKLEALLKRVEARRAAPRLQVIPQPPPQPMKAAPIVEPVSASLPAPAFEPATLPPVQEPARKSVSMTPLEDAMAQLDNSGPLPLEALSEPIPAPRRESLPQPFPEEAESAEQPIELTQPARKTGLREPTLAFETPKLAARELRPIGEPPAELRAAPPEVVVAPLTAPSQTIQATALPKAQPARVVSPARIAVAKTFGELLDVSLSLRPGHEAKGA